jgi:hypothetical protein
MSDDESAGTLDLSNQGQGSSKRKGAGSKYKMWTSESKKHGVGEEKVNGVKIAGGEGVGSKSDTVQENKYSHEEEHHWGEESAAAYEFRADSVRMWSSLDLICEENTVRR